MKRLIFLILILLVTNSLVYAIEIDFQISNTQFIAGESPADQDTLEFTITNENETINDFFIDFPSFWETVIPTEIYIDSDSYFLLRSQSADTDTNVIAWYFNSNENRLEFRTESDSVYTNNTVMICFYAVPPTNAISDSLYWISPQVHDDLTICEWEISANEIVSLNILNDASEPINQFTPLSFTAGDDFVFQIEGVDRYNNRNRILTQSDITSFLWCSNDVASRISYSSDFFTFNSTKSDNGIFDLSFGVISAQIDTFIINPDTRYQISLATVYSQDDTLTNISLVDGDSLFCHLQVRDQYRNFIRNADPNDDLISMSNIEYIDIQWIGTDTLRLFAQYPGIGTSVQFYLRNGPFRPSSISIQTDVTVGLPVKLALQDPEDPGKVLDSLKISIGDEISSYRIVGVDLQNNITGKIISDWETHELVPYANSYGDTLVSDYIPLSLTSSGFIYINSVNDANLSGQIHVNVIKGDLYKIHFSVLPDSIRSPDNSVFTTDDTIEFWFLPSDSMGNLRDDTIDYSNLIHDQFDLGPVPNVTSNKITFLPDRSGSIDNFTFDLEFVPGISDNVFPDTLFNVEIVAGYPSDIIFASSANETDIINIDDYISSSTDSCSFYIAFLDSAGNFISNLSPDQITWSNGFSDYFNLLTNGNEFTITATKSTPTDSAFTLSASASMGADNLQTDIVDLIVDPGPASDIKIQYVGQSTYLNSLSFTANQPSKEIEFRIVDVYGNVISGMPRSNLPVIYTFNGLYPSFSPVGGTSITPHIFTRAPDVGTLNLVFGVPGVDTLRNEYQVTVENSTAARFDVSTSKTSFESYQNVSITAGDTIRLFSVQLDSAENILDYQPSSISWHVVPDSFSFETTTLDSLVDVQTKTGTIDSIYFTTGDPSPETYGVAGPVTILPGVPTQIEIVSTFPNDTITCDEVLELWVYLLDSFGNRITALSGNEVQWSGYENSFQMLFSEGHYIFDPNSTQNFENVLTQFNANLTVPAASDSFSITVEPGEVDNLVVTSTDGMTEYQSLSYTAGVTGSAYQIKATDTDGNRISFPDFNYSFLGLLPEYNDSSVDQIPSILFSRAPDTGYLITEALGIRDTTEVIVELGPEFQIVPSTSDQEYLEIGDRVVYAGNNLIIHAIVTDSQYNFVRYPTNEEVIWNFPDFWSNSDEVDSTGNPLIFSPTTLGYSGIFEPTITGLNSQSTGTITVYGGEILSFNTESRSTNIVPGGTAEFEISVSNQTNIQGINPTLDFSSPNCQLSFNTTGITSIPIGNSFHEQIEITFPDTLTVGRSISVTPHFSWLTAIDGDTIRARSRNPLILNVVDYPTVSAEFTNILDTIINIDNTFEFGISLELEENSDLSNLIYTSRNCSLNFYLNDQNYYRFPCQLTENTLSPGDSITAFNSQVNANGWSTGEYIVSFTSYDIQYGTHTIVRDSVAAPESLFILSPLVVSVQNVSPVNQIVRNFSTEYSLTLTPSTAQYQSWLDVQTAELVITSNGISETFYSSTDVDLLHQLPETFNFHIFVPTNSLLPDDQFMTISANIDGLNLDQSTWDNTYTTLPQIELLPEIDFNVEAVEDLNYIAGEPGIITFQVSNEGQTPFTLDNESTFLKIDGEPGLITPISNNQSQLEQYQEGSMDFEINLFETTRLDTFTTVHCTLSVGIQEGINSVISTYEDAFNARINTYPNISISDFTLLDSFIVDSFPKTIKIKLENHDSSSTLFIDTIRSTINDIDTSLIIVSELLDTLSSLTITIFDPLLVEDGLESTLNRTITTEIIYRDAALNEHTNSFERVITFLPVPILNINDTGLSSNDRLRATGEIENPEFTVSVDHVADGYQCIIDTNLSTVAFDLQGEISLTNNYDISSETILLDETERIIGLKPVSYSDFYKGSYDVILDLTTEYAGERLSLTDTSLSLYSIYDTIDEDEIQLSIGSIENRRINAGDSVSFEFTIQNLSSDVLVTGLEIDTVFFEFDPVESTEEGHISYALSNYRTTLSSSESITITSNIFSHLHSPNGQYSLAITMIGYQEHSILTNRTPFQITSQVHDFFSIEPQISSVLVLDTAPQRVTLGQADVEISYTLNHQDISEIGNQAIYPLETDHYSITFSDDSDTQWAIDPTFVNSASLPDSFTHGESFDYLFNFDIPDDDNLAKDSPLAFSTSLFFTYGVDGDTFEIVQNSYESFHIQTSPILQIVDLAFSPNSFVYFGEDSISTEDSVSLDLTIRNDGEALLFIDQERLLDSLLVSVQNTLGPGSITLVPESAYSSDTLHNGETCLLSWDVLYLQVPEEEKYIFNTTLCGLDVNSDSIVISSNSSFDFEVLSLRQLTCNRLQSDIEIILGQEYVDQEISVYFSSGCKYDSLSLLLMYEYEILDSISVLPDEQPESNVSGSFNYRFHLLTGDILPQAPLNSNVYVKWGGKSTIPPYTWVIDTIPLLLGDDSECMISVYSRGNVHLNPDVVNSTVFSYGEDVSLIDLALELSGDIDAEYIPDFVLFNPWDISFSFTDTLSQLPLTGWHCEPVSRADTSLFPLDTILSLSPESILELTYNIASSGSLPDDHVPVVVEADGYFRNRLDSSFVENVSSETDTVRVIELPFNVLDIDINTELNTSGTCNYGQVIELSMSLFRTNERADGVDSVVVVMDCDSQFTLSTADTNIILGDYDPILNLQEISINEQFEVADSFAYDFEIFFSDTDVNNIQFSSQSGGNIQSSTSSDLDELNEAVISLNTTILEYQSVSFDTVFTDSSTTDTESLILQNPANVNLAYSFNFPHQNGITLFNPRNTGENAQPDTLEIYVWAINHGEAGIDTIGRYNIDLPSILEFEGLSTTEYSGTIRLYGEIDTLKVVPVDYSDDETFIRFSYTPPTDINSGESAEISHNIDSLGIRTLDENISLPIISINADSVYESSACTNFPTHIKAESVSFDQEIFTDLILELIVTTQNDTNLLDSIQPNPIVFYFNDQSDSAETDFIIDRELLSEADSIGLSIHSKVRGNFTRRSDYYEKEFSETYDFTVYKTPIIRRPQFVLTRQMYDGSMETGDVAEVNQPLEADILIPVDGFLHPLSSDSVDVIIAISSDQNTSESIQDPGSIKNAGKDEKTDQKEFSTASANRKTNCSNSLNDYNFDIRVPLNRSTSVSLDSIETSGNWTITYSFDSLPINPFTGTSILSDFQEETRYVDIIDTVQITLEALIPEIISDASNFNVTVYYQRTGSSISIEDAPNVEELSIGLLLNEDLLSSAITPYNISIASTNETIVFPVSIKSLPDSTNDINTSIQVQILDPIRNDLSGTSVIPGFYINSITIVPSTFPNFSQSSLGWSSKDSLILESKIIVENLNNSRSLSVFMNPDCLSYTFDNSRIEPISLGSKYNIHLAPGERDSLLHRFMSPISDNQQIIQNLLMDFKPNAVYYSYENSEIQYVSDNYWTEIPSLNLQYPYPVSINADSKNINNLFDFSTLFTIEFNENVTIDVDSLNRYLNMGQSVFLVSDLLSGTICPIDTVFNNQSNSINFKIKAPYTLPAYDEFGINIDPENPNRFDLSPDFKRSFITSVSTGNPVLMLYETGILPGYIPLGFEDDDEEPSIENSFCLPPENEEDGITIGFIVYDNSDSDDQVSGIDPGNIQAYLFEDQASTILNSKNPYSISKSSIDEIIEIPTENIAYTPLPSREQPNLIIQIPYELVSDLSLDNLGVGVRIHDRSGNVDSTSTSLGNLHPTSREFIDHFVLSPSPWNPSSDKTLLLQFSSKIENTNATIFITDLNGIPIVKLFDNGTPTSFTSSVNLYSSVNNGDDHHYLHEVYLQTVVNRLPDGAYLVIGEIDGKIEKFVWFLIRN